MSLRSLITIAAALVTAMLWNGIERIASHALTQQCDAGQIAYCSQFSHLALALVALLLSGLVSWLVLRLARVPAAAWVAIVGSLSGYCLQTASLLFGPALVGWVVYGCCFIAGYAAGYCIFVRWQARFSYKLYAAAGMILFGILLRELLFAWLYKM